MLLGLIYASILILCRGFEAAATDDDGVLRRLQALELQQRQNAAEIKSLSSVTSEQQLVIEEQALRIQQLEKQVAIQNTGSHVNNRQIKQCRRELIQVRDLFIKYIQKHTDKEELESEGGQVDVNHGRYVEPKAVGASTNYERSFNIRRQSNSGIAFSVYLDHPVVLNNEQTLKFNQIITNEGNGYNVYSGFFTSPEAGVYLFSFTIAIRGIEQCWVKLMVNNVIQVVGNAEGSHDIQDIQGGNTVVIRLHAGDVVSIGSLNSQTYHANGGPGARVTTFTGVFLYA